MAEQRNTIEAEGGQPYHPCVTRPPLPTVLLVAVEQGSPAPDSLS